MHTLINLYMQYTKTIAYYAYIMFNVIVILQIMLKTMLAYIIDSSLY